MDAKPRGTHKEATLDVNVFLRVDYHTVIKLPARLDLVTEIKEMFPPFLFFSVIHRGGP